MNKKEKQFTWRDLKAAVNKIPEKHLSKRVVIWTDDEKAYRVNEVEVLKEDYLFDGDEGCAPRSVMKYALAEEKTEFPDTASDYILQHEKGTRIICAD